MKTDSDYLWDKTGEPDPEIQKLEEILGTLRYQPRSLDIPAGVAVSRERSFFRSAAPRLAIAATLAMLLIGLGVWFAWQRSQRVVPSEVAKSTDKPGAQPAQQPAPNPTQAPQVAAVLKLEETAEPSPRQRRTQRLSQSFVAGNSNRVRKEADARRAKERQEAAIAKDQLLLALRVTSAKLNFAQKKTQTTNSPEPVHNQHKIG